MAKIATSSTRGSAGFAGSALGQNIKRNTDAIVAGSARAGAALTNLEIKQIATGKAATVMGASFSRAADALQIVQGPLGPLAGRLSALGQVLRSLVGFTLAGTLAGGGAFALGAISTQYQRVHDTLVPLFDDQTKLNVAMNDVVGIAGRTRQALQPVADLYAQLTRVARDAGISQERAARLTETVSKASQIGGGTAEARQAAIVQFGQALSANFRGSGQELQSILEQAPALAQAIAKGLGTQASKLKQLAQDGKLSTEIVVKALERSAAEIDERFARLPPRIGKSLTELTNNFALFVGHLDETTGATTGVANAITFLAEHLSGLALIAGTTAAAFGASTFAGAVKGIGTWIDKITLAQAEYNNLINLQRAGNVVILGSAQAMELRAGFVHQAAVEENALAQASVRAAQEYQAQVRAQIALLEQQIAAQVKALEMARTLDAANRASGGVGNAPLVKAAYQDLNASERALLLTQEQLVAADAELAAANVRLAASTTAVAVADEELIVAEAAAIASSGRLAAVKSVLAGAMARAQGAAASLSTFLGGPWGIAFAAAAAAAFTLASMTEKAKEAAERFAGGQDELRRQLGLTTDKLAGASAEARNLALNLARADVAQKKGALYDTGRDLASSLYAARFQLPIGSKDANDLKTIADRLRQGQVVTDAGQRMILDIFARNQRLQQGTLLGSVAGLLGADPKDTTTKIMGVRQSFKELADAERELVAVQAELNKPQNALLGGGGKATTKAQLNADARVLAAKTDLEKARAELGAATTRGPLEGETDEQYKQRIAGLISSVQGLIAAHKAAAAAKAEERHQQALLNKELAAAEAARDKGSRLAGIGDQFSEDTPVKRLERLRDAAAQAKRAIDDLVGERVIDKKGDRIFSAAEAQQKKDQIDDYTRLQERKPVDDSIQRAEEELHIQSLIAKGLGDQAEFMRRKVELEKQSGPLLDADAEIIRGQIADQNRLNDILYERNAIIENNARMLDSFRDSLQNAIKAALMGDFKGGIKEFVRGMYQAFAEAKANEIVMKLIGDPGKRYRDEMTRGLNDSAGKLSNSAGGLSSSASQLSEAASALSAAAGVGAGGTGDPAASLFSDVMGNVLGATSPDADLASILTDGLDPAVAALYNLQGPIEDAAAAMGEASDAIVITGTRLKQNQPGNTTDMLNSLGTKLGTLIAGPNSVLTKVLGQLGTALQGAGYGASASGLFGAISGVDQSNTGAMIGGALGAIAGSFIPGVGNIIGSVVGGVLGGTIGGLFKKKAPSGGVSITSLNPQDLQYSGSGSLKGEILGAGNDVISGLQKISDALGGTVGQFAVSIGKYDGDYRVNTYGYTGKALRAGSPGTVDFDQDYEAAVKFAIMNAIQDGAINGIRESTKRLLMAGQDLDAALEKALKFEDVFKRLKRLKDPVGAAIDDLNLEFMQLIEIFKEAGASAEEWAQLQELYDLERADAIKQATQAAVQLLDDFIQSMTSGPDSPLSKRTVYENAKAEVDKFRADIAAGKPVDQEALVKALDNFEQASADLYGSRAQFYADFADILALATAARANVDTGDGTLPPSPFDTLTPIAQQQLSEQQTTNDQLGIIIGLLGGSSGSGTSGSGSTIDDLPAVSGSGGTGQPVSLA